MALESEYRKKQYGNIQCYTFPEAKQVGEFVAHQICQLVKSKGKETKTVLGLATGSSPIPTYQALKKLYHRDESLDFSNVVTFNLDEYLDILPTHSESYRSFMFTHFFTPDMLYSSSNPRGFRKENIFIPRGMAKQWNQLNEEERNHIASSLSCDIQEDGVLSEEQERCVLQFRTKHYETQIKDYGPVDLQILGIGHNGHIGFAEPGSSFSGETMMITLTKETRMANSRFFDDKLEDTPRYAITMGVGTILRAQQIILIATGESKSEIVEKTLLCVPPNEAIPASALHQHNNALMVIDQLAAKKIEK